MTTEAGGREGERGGRGERERRGGEGRGGNNLTHPKTCPCVPYLGGMGGGPPAELADIRGPGVAAWYLLFPNIACPPIPPGVPWRGDWVP